MIYAFQPKETVTHYLLPTREEVNININEIFPAFTSENLQDATQFAPDALNDLYFQSLEGYPEASKLTECCLAVFKNATHLSNLKKDNEIRVVYGKIDNGISFQWIPPKYIFNTPTWMMGILSGYDDYRLDKHDKAISLMKKTDVFYNTTSNKVFFKRLIDAVRIFPELSNLSRVATKEDFTKINNLGFVIITDDLTAYNKRMLQKLALISDSVKSNSFINSEGNQWHKETLFAYNAEFSSGCLQVDNNSEKLIINDNAGVQRLYELLNTLLHNNHISKTPQVATSVKPLKP